MLVLFLVSYSATMCAQRLSMFMDMVKLVALTPNLSKDLILSPQISLNTERNSLPIANRLRYIYEFIKTETEATIYANE